MSPPGDGGSDPRAFTAVLSVPVAPDEGDAFARLHDRSIERMRAMPGFLSSELLRPAPGAGGDTVILLTFDTREHLDGWLRSADRRHLIDLQRPHVLGPRTVNVVGGFAGWFRGEAGGDVARWRSAVAVLIAIVPVSQVYLWIRLALFPGLNVVVATFIGNVLTVITLTWALMPLITARLGRWLRRPVPDDEGLDLVADAPEDLALVSRDDREPAQEPEK